MVSFNCFSKIIKGGILKWPPLIVLKGAFLDAQFGKIVTEESSSMS